MDKNTETKNKLLEAACAVFREKGYEKAKVSDIVAMANVAQGTFYLYFKSKKECLNTMSGMLIDSMLDELHRESDSMDHETIHRVLDVILNHLEQHREIISIIHFEQANMDESIPEKFKEIQRSFHGTISKSFLASGLSPEASEYKTMLIIAAVKQYLVDEVFVFNESFINKTVDLRSLLDIILEKVKF